MAYDRVKEDVLKGLDVNQERLRMIFEELDRKGRVFKMVEPITEKARREVQFRRPSTTLDR